MTWEETPPVVVLIARQFNPSVLTQMWLVDNGILDKMGSYKPESIFTANLVQVITDEFVLVVTPDQLQFLLNVPPEEQQQLIKDKLGTLVKSLPHVPYRAVGLNFHWHLTPDEGQVPAYTRELFCGKGGGIHARFTDPNARFGAYMSKDFGSFRLKLDMKPINVETEGQKEDRVQFGFNFHSDLPQGKEAAEAMIERFGHWNEVRKEAMETMRVAGFEDEQ
ncbi:MAG TPA: hypothetical protein VH092_20245 [Urbifossiella sp.]|jgi:hypothetical protein|nr:hypothetical protein [Urbifossiella sp.]